MFLSPQWVIHPWLKLLSEDTGKSPERFGLWGDARSGPLRVISTLSNYGNTFEFQHLSMWIVCDPLEEEVKQVYLAHPYYITGDSAAVGDACWSLFKGWGADAKGDPTKADLSSL